MLFQPNSIQGKELRGYVDLGAYDLAIDNGRETLEITDQNAWSSIECGTTIFMNIVLVRGPYGDWDKCPICDTKNYFHDYSAKFTIYWCVIIFLVIDTSIYIFTVVIAKGYCKVRILKALKTLQWTLKRTLNLFVTSVFTNL